MFFVQFAVNESVFRPRPRRTGKSWLRVYSTYGQSLRQRRPGWTWQPWLSVFTWQSCLHGGQITEWEWGIMGTLRCVFMSQSASMRAECVLTTCNCGESSSLVRSDSDRMWTKWNRYTERDRRGRPASSGRTRWAVIDPRRGINRLRDAGCPGGRGEVYTSAFILNNTTLRNKHRVQRGRATKKVHESRRLIQLQ